MLELKKCTINLAFETESDCDKAEKLIKKEKDLATLELALLYREQTTLRFSSITNPPLRGLITLMWHMKDATMAATIKRGDTIIANIVCENARMTAKWVHGSLTRDLKKYSWGEIQDAATEVIRATKEQNPKG